MQTRLQLILTKLLTLNNFIKMLTTGYNNKTQPCLNAANLRLSCVLLYRAKGPIGSRCTPAHFSQGPTGYDGSELVND